MPLLHKEGMKMDKLIEVLPQFIFNIALGFIFLRFFRYSCSIKNSNETEHIVWESLLTGFVIRACFSIIPFSINYAVDRIGMIIFTIIVALISGRIYSDERIDKLFRKLKIYRTRNAFIWQDLQDKDFATFVKVVNPETNEAYYGALKYFEDFERQPQIVLWKFKYWKDVDKDVTLDFSNDNHCMTLVDTSKFSQVYFVYNCNSEKIKNKDE